MTAWRLRKWISLGAALGAGALGTERILASHRAESDRDTALAALPLADTGERLDTLRAEVVDREGARGTAEVVGFSVLGGASALLVWSAIEWIWGEPGAGKLEGDGVGPVTEAP